MRHAAHSPKACVASTTVVGGLRKSHRAWREEALETVRVGAAAMGGTDEGAQAKKMKKNKQTREWRATGLTACPALLALVSGGRRRAMH